MNLLEQVKNRYNISNILRELLLKVKKLESGSSTGNFIPLTGTTEGNPITNELLMKNTDLASTSVRLFFYGLEWLTETGNELISDMAVISKDNGGFLIDADYQAEEEGDNLAFGLSGKKDFSEIDPENKLIYAQRSYVDKQNLISLTLSELNTLISNNNLQVGTTYEISGVQPFLYGGTTIWLKAISTSQLEEKGMGKFYVPKYDKEIDGYGIWLGKLFNAGLVDEPTYAINDKVIWGGKVWKNLTGDLGVEVDIFLLDDVNWESIPFNEIDYNIEYDEIGYDIDNDCINYRKDKSNNEMSFSYNWWYKLENDSFDGDMLNSKINPIKSFQWGNHFDYSVGKGNMTNKCNNSFIENTNAVGSYYDNYLKNNGYINSNTLNNGYIYSNTLNNGSINSNTLNNGSINSNTLKNNGYINNNTLENNGYINSNTLDNGYIYSNTLDNGYINNNTLENNGYINSNTLENNGSINYNTLENSGYIRLGLTNPINNKTIQYLTINTGDIGGDLGIDLSNATLVYADYERIVFKNSVGVTKIRYIDGSGNMVIAALDD